MKYIIHEIPIYVLTKAPHVEVVVKPNFMPDNL